MPALSDYLLKTSASIIQPNLFVRLLNNRTGLSYISDGVTDSNGKFTMVANPPPPGVYTVFTGAVATIGGTATATGDTGYIVPPTSTPFLNAQDYGAGDLVSSSVLIDNAVQDAYNAGGGTVFLPPVANGYILTRLLGGGFAQKGGGIRLRKGVSLLGSKTKLLLRDNCDFITHRNASNYTATVATITADVAYGDTQVTVDSSAGFAVGNDVYIRAGNSGLGETAESRWFSFAKVLTIADGTHITLDRPILNAFTVAATAANNRTITLLDDLFEGVSIGGFELISQTASSGNAESGVSLFMARNIRLYDLVGDDVGAGLVGTQYCENIKGENFEIRQCQKQGQASKGRCFNFAETIGVEFENVRGEKFENTFAFAEFFCRNIRFKNTRVTNNFVGRVQTIALFATQASDMRFEGLLVEGNGSVWQDDGGVSTTYPGQDQDPALRFRDVTIRTTTAGNGPPALWQFEGLLRVRGGLPAAIQGDYYDIKRFSKTFPLLPNQSGYYTLTMPTGLYRRAKVFVTSKTGITQMFLQSGGSNSSGDFVASLANGQLIDMTSVAFPYGLVNSPANDFNSAALTGRLLAYLSDGTVPANGYGVVEIEYYPTGGTTGIAPFPDDGSGGYAHDGTLYSKINRLSLTGDLIHSVRTTTPTGATPTYTPDATTGEAQEIIQGTTAQTLTIAAPTNRVAGQFHTFKFVHFADAVAWTLVWNAVYKRAGGAFANTNTSGAVDTITFYDDGTNLREVGRALNLS